MLMSTASPRHRSFLRYNKGTSTQAFLGYKMLTMGQTLPGIRVNVSQRALSAMSLSLAIFRILSVTRNVHGVITMVCGLSTHSTCTSTVAVSWNSEKHPLNAFHSRVRFLNTVPAHVHARPSHALPCTMHQHPE